ncbi:MAG: type I glutamate--ammonia ligase [Calditrichaeota bacterium]|nr:MAG: type I glutamate--ammonia ligase [Calditrichota bacterium]
MLSKSEVLSLAKDANVEYVNMQFTDLFGTLKALTIPVSKLEEAIDNNVWFDGSSIDGFTRISESDMYLKPDLSTFAILPWTRQSDHGVMARIICDVFMPEGTPFEGSPRYILQRQLERLEKLGYTFNVGPELEFFIFNKDSEGNVDLTPHDNAGYFDQTTDLGVELRKEMSNALKSFNIDVEALHHEVAPGQHEIGFKYGDALSVADKIISYKDTLKFIAKRNNLHITFMPKPVAGENGSGMHVHQSIADKDGKNLFYDANGEYSLSDLAKYFIAGQLKHIKAMNAIINPTINSYKRLVVGYEAPVYVAWGQKNRSALIRIPRLTKGSEARATRCELRCPDPTTNPYLAFAVMIAAGLDGIENKLPLAKPVEENIFEFSVAKAASKGIETVAINLYDAIQNFEKDEVIKSAIGEMTAEKIINAKNQEWDNYRLHVSDWELDNYLTKY